MTNTYYIVLHPIDPRARVGTLSKLAIKAQTMELIGSSYFYGRTHSKGRSVIYTLGNRYEEYFESPSECYASLIFQQPNDKPDVFGGENINDPICPTCQYSKTNWAKILGEWYGNYEDNSYRWRCPRCKQENQIQDLNWQHTAGFACYGICIEYPWDDMPTELLLNTLADVFGTDFTYTQVFFP